MMGIQNPGFNQDFMGCSKRSPGFWAPHFNHSGQWLCSSLELCALAEVLVVDWVKDLVDLLKMTLVVS